MFSITPPAGIAPEPDDPPLVEIGAYPSSGDAFDHGLVVLAMGRSYWVEESAGRFRLLVEPEDAPDLREQLVLYDRESTAWPPLPATDDQRSFAPGAWLGALLWALAVLLVFRVQLERPGALEAAGALNPAAIFERGEWQRLFTALFLHGDAMHAAANVLSGFFALGLVFGLFGVIRGCLLLGIASIAANLAATAIHLGQPYQSLGASTAIFAALGLLAGRETRSAYAQAAPLHRWRRVLAPLAAALALLGLLGAGGPQTDVAAHAFGLGAGVLLGLRARAR